MKASDGKSVGLYHLVTDAVVFIYTAAMIHPYIKFI